MLYVLEVKKIFSTGGILTLSLVLLNNCAFTTTTIWAPTFCNERLSHTRRDIFWFQISLAPRTTQFPNQCNRTRFFEPIDQLLKLWLGTLLANKITSFHFSPSAAPQTMALAEPLPFRARVRLTVLNNRNPKAATLLYFGFEAGNRRNHWNSVTTTDSNLSRLRSRHHHRLRHTPEDVSTAREGARTASWLERRSDWDWKLCLVNLFNRHRCRAVGIAGIMESGAFRVKRLSRFSSVLLVSPRSRSLSGI